MATKTIFQVGYGVNAGRSRSEIYDLEYGKCTPTTGNKPIRGPYNLGYKKDGTFLMGMAAYNEAMKPIHGPEGNKSIPDLLPILEKLPSAKILGTDPWHPYPDEVPPILIGDYYEGHDDGRYGSVRQYNLYHEEVDDLDTWDNLGIVEWRVKGTQEVYIDNPLYQPAVDRNNIRVETYTLVLKQYFIPTANYQFPGYALGQWEWFEDGIKIGGMNTEPKIPLDVNHWLAGPTTGWKMIIRSIKEGTALFTNQWKSKVDNTILYAPPQFPADKRLKMLLGIY